MMIHKDRWADFTLKLDFKISQGCNSGVFVRTFPLTPRPGKDVGFNGIEIAIDDTTACGLPRYRSNLRPGQAIEKRHEARGPVEPHGDHLRRTKTLGQAQRRARHADGPGPVDEHRTVAPTARSTNSTLLTKTTPGQAISACRIMGRRAGIRISRYCRSNGESPASLINSS